ncbi:hypothetical protein [Vulcanococcus limneticus]|uniref:hypothetical protein n=1 Tax=Vulcanococcus limneticus TaxID=2170428 RepID=UPI00398BEC57
MQTPHLSSDCAECSRTAYYVRHDPETDGIKLEAGERFTIPAGFIQLSLEPSGRGKLFRPGVPFLLKQFFLNQHPKSKEEVEDLLKSLEAEADAILKASPLLKDLDLEKDSDAQTGWVRIRDKTDSREFHAASLGSFAKVLETALETNDTQLAAWAAYMAGTCRGLTIVTEPLFEQTLWRGYLANDVVYEAISAASRTPAEAEAMKKLAPLFQRLDEMTLHAWVECKLPIGPRIGVKNLPEELLSALAKWHLSSFHRQREDALRAKADSRATSEMRLKWLSFGLAIPTVIIAVLKYAGGG